MRAQNAPTRLEAHERPVAVRQRRLLPLRPPSVDERAAALALTRGRRRCGSHQRASLEVEVVVSFVVGESAGRWGEGEELAHQPRVPRRRLLAADRQDLHLEDQVRVRLDGARRVRPVGVAAGHVHACDGAEGEGLEGDLHARDHFIPPDGPRRRLALALERLRARPIHAAPRVCEECSIVERDAVARVGDAASFTQLEDLKNDRGGRLEGGCAAW